MKLYTVSNARPDYAASVASMYGNGRDQVGPRVFSRSAKWDNAKTVVSGAVGMMDLEVNPKKETILVTGLNSGSAFFYLYVDPDSTAQGIAAVLVFHSPDGSLDITAGQVNKGKRLEGPINEARKKGHTARPKDVKVLIVAGPHAMDQFASMRGKPTYKDAVRDSYEKLLEILRGEEILQGNILAYCSSGAEFGINADGMLGEPAEPLSATSTANKKRRCYISTATCASLGLPDDCEELTLLRFYRDSVLLRTPEGRRDVQTYYDTAPQIVAAIDARPDAAIIYRDIFAKSLAPAIAALRRTDFDQAYTLYRQLVTQLQSRYL